MRRVLIDECINPGLTRRLRSELIGPVSSIHDLGWAGRKDNAIIRDIAGRFDVFVTLDKGFQFEHNVARLPFGIIVVKAANNQMNSYARLLHGLINEIATVSAGSVVHVIDPHLLQPCK